MKKILIILIIFFCDRVVKVYFINLENMGTDVDFYIFPFLNFFLAWNTGIGFGLFSTEPNFFYHLITALILAISLVLAYLIYKLKNFQAYYLCLILGGSLSNLFDRIYYQAVPDFIDFHYENFHWFVFNVADIFITVGIIGLILFEIKFKSVKND